MEKIVIKFKYDKKHGCHRISCKGNASNEHIWVACQKLNLNEVEPTKFKKIKHTVKKFIKCLKFALSKEELSSGLVRSGK